MTMVLPDKIEETMNEWPIFWAGGALRSRLEYGKILSNLKILWSLIDKDVLDETTQEIHFKAIWTMGYELSRDRIISRKMSDIPVRFRVKQMIEDGGPLLFGFYSSDDEIQFGKCCETFERSLRRANLWEEYSQGAVT